MNTKLKALLVSLIAALVVIPPLAMPPEPVYTKAPPGKYATPVSTPGAKQANAATQSSSPAPNVYGTNPQYSIVTLSWAEAAANQVVRVTGPIPPGSEFGTWWYIATAGDYFAPTHGDVLEHSSTHLVFVLSNTDSSFFDVANQPDVLISVTHTDQSPY